MLNNSGNCDVPGSRQSPLLSIFFSHAALALGPFCEKVTGWLTPPLSLRGHAWPCKISVTWFKL